MKKQLKSLVGTVHGVVDKAITERKVFHNNPDQRLTICNKCNFKKINVCTKCGCYLPAKVKILGSKCPIDRW